MTTIELLSKTIETEHGLFRPIYSYEEEVPIYDEEGNITDYELIGYVETMTAEEHYQKWLYDKENPPKQETSLEDKISILENENEELKARVDMAENALLDIMINQMRV